MVDWLHCRDQNSKFFHAMHRSRTNYKTLSMITSAYGIRVESQKGIASLFESHFKEFYNMKNKMEIDEYFQPKRKLTPVASTWLSRPFSEEEILKGLNSIHRDKALGPNGFSSGFFQDNWTLIKKEVIKATNNFFKHGRMLKEVNRTHICLLQKHSNAERVEDFRPISLCNTMYKIIAKCLADHLKKYLPELISKNQSAYIAGRKIEDNIILAQELLKGFNQKQTANKLCVQIDISKAFDVINRDFVILMLQRMGFKDKFIGWIRACITTTSFSILVNGYPSNFFEST